jgi:hypothetical protein
MLANMPPAGYILDNHMRINRMTLFQAIAFLSVMSTTLCCAVFGLWLWCVQIFALHMLTLGIAVTGVTLERELRYRGASKVRPGSTNLSVEPH